MKILDIDMDFFLNEVARSKGFDGERLSEEDFHPWSEDRVIKFLEKNCGLSKGNRKPGAIFREHIGTYYALKELIEKKCLIPPFELVHIDAHADLGLGDAAWSFIFESLLGFPVEERLERVNMIDDNFYNVSSGNYLLFMTALEWISSLTYIPHFSEHGDDYLIEIMKDFSDDTKIIQMKHFYNGINHECGAELSKQPFIPKCEIPFNIIQDINETNYENNEFDFIFLSQSESYTPASADFIIDIVNEYINFDSFRKSVE